MHRVEHVRFDVAALMQLLDDVVLGRAENGSDRAGDELGHGWKATCLALHSWEGREGRRRVSHALARDHLAAFDA
jgi:hypothetical protein